MSLLLTMSLGEIRCAIPAREVIRILPRVEVTPLAGTPPFVAGAMNFHGRVVPVVDLCQLVCDRPSRPVYSTRIVVVNYPQDQLLGLMAERVTGTCRRSAEEFEPVQLSRSAWMGDVSSKPEGTIQALQVENLFSPEVRDLLFSGAPTGE